MAKAEGAVMAQVELFKRKGTYVDEKDGKEKHFTNFYVRCGDSMVPVQVVYYEGDDGRDYNYSSRKSVLSAFAETLPEKPSTKGDNVKAQKSSKPKEEDEERLPF